MEIYVENKSQNPLNDILETILNLDEESFESLKNTCDGSHYEKLRFIYGDEKVKVPLFKILSYLQEAVSDKDSMAQERIDEIIESRNDDMFCSISTGECDGIKMTEYPLVKKVFEILKNDELYEKFLNFDECKDELGFPEPLRKRYQNICSYLRVMVSIFGSVDKSGELVNGTSLVNEFYIPELDECKERYISVYKQYEPLVKEEEKKLKYKFETRKTGDEKVTIIEGEPDWALNDEIKNTVLDGIPDDLSTEEKAIYIYTKMCRVFAYDEGYMYRHHELGKKVNYTNEFSKEHLESLTTESKITCFDFCRIYKKIVDNLDEPITVAILGVGDNNGHFYLGFATDNCQATLEAINLTEKDGFRGSDLARAKNNMSLNGIRSIDGDEKYIDDAVDKAEGLLLNNPGYSTRQYIKQLMLNVDIESQEQFQVDDIGVFKGLIEKMQKLHISGNEFVMFFNDIYRRFGILNERLEKAFIGEVINEENSKTYRRKIWLRERQKDNLGNSKMYLIDVNSLDISTPSGLQMYGKLLTGEYVYEKMDHQMRGFEVEEI